MGLATRQRIAKLYQEGKWNQNDMVAKAFADEFPMEPEPVVEEKTSKKKGGK